MCCVRDKETKVQPRKQVARADVVGSLVCELASQVVLCEAKKQRFR